MKKVGRKKDLEMLQMEERVETAEAPVNALKLQLKKAMIES